MVISVSGILNEFLWKFHFDLGSIKPFTDMVTRGLFFCWGNEKPLAKMVKTGNSCVRWQVFLHSSYVSDVIGARASQQPWGQGGGQIDGLTDTAEGAENLCMQGGVNPWVHVCVCDVRERARALVHVKSSVVLHWDAQLILCQNNLQLPDACTVFSFFSINVSELVCYLNMGDWTLCHTRGCPSGDCKGAQTKTKFDWPALVRGGGLWPNPDHF